MCQETRRICETVMVQKSCYSADKPKHSAKKLLVRQFAEATTGLRSADQFGNQKFSYFITKVIYYLHSYWWFMYPNAPSMEYLPTLPQNISGVSAFLGQDFQHSHLVMQKKTSPFQKGPTTSPMKGWHLTILAPFWWTLPKC